MPPHVLNDYLASLRMADSLVSEFAGAEDLLGESGAPLASVLERAYNEIAGMYESVRRSRALLERTPVERSGQEPPGAVTCATGTTASDMLEGLDRARSLVDDPDGADGALADHDACDCMREELFRVISCVQFQAITPQQIAYAAGVLQEFERRMQLLMAVLEQSMKEPGDEAAEPTDELHVFDSAASPHVGARQTAANERSADQPD